MLTQLEELVKDNKTATDEYKIQLAPQLNIKEFVEFFKANPFTIKKIELTFTSDLDAAQRSKLTTDIAAIFDTIQGIEVLILGSTVKDYVLEDLLNLDAISNIQGLKFSFNHPEVINTRSFFENTLPIYLNKNQNLNSLAISGSHTEITAKSYPKLTKVLCAHTNLIQFKQDEYSLRNIKSNALEHDPELKKVLKQNCKNNPETIKINLLKQLENLPKKVCRTIENLDTNIAGRKFMLRSDDRKEFINAALRFRLDLERLKELKNDLSKPNLQIDELDDKKTSIAVLIQYVALLAQAAELRSLSGLEDMAPFESKINKFWDVTRLTMFNDIKEVNKGDFTSILKHISDETSELNKIRKKVPSRIYPESYAVITKSVSDNLLKARKILDDYTKSNSAVSRFFHGHWNRHHVAEVHALVMRIDGKNGEKITSTNALVAELRQIELTNDHGSLARRIDFITDNFMDSSMPENPSNSSLIKNYK